MIVLVICLSRTIFVLVAVTECLGNWLYFSVIETFVPFFRKAIPQCIGHCMMMVSQCMFISEGGSIFMYFTVQAAGCGGEG